MYPLIVALSFYTVPDDTSSYISFISDAPSQTIIKSHNISNSIDPNLKVRDYEFKLTGNDSTATGNADTTCREIATQKITPILISFPYLSFGYYLYLHRIELKHSHMTYEKFVNLCGKREVYIKGKKIGEHTFPPRDYIGPNKSHLIVGDSSSTEEGYLYLTLQGDNMYADRWFDQHFPAAPATKYHISFSFLIPMGASPGTEFIFETAECEDTRFYKKPIKEVPHKLKGNYYWRGFDKYITTTDKTTDIRVIFRVENSPDAIGDLMVKDFKLRRLSAVNKGP